MKTRLRPLIALLGLAALPMLILFAALAHLDKAEAQASEIQILNHRVETNFPTNVTFYVEVAGPDAIQEVRVVMKTIGQTSRSAYRQVEFEPATQVSGEAELLTSGNNYVPPGTRMAYYFEVRDQAGREFRTEEEIFVYLDNRFEWLTVSEGIITVYYNDPLVKSRAEHVLETALTSMAITGPLLGVTPELPLHIVTYHKYGEMIGALPFRSQATARQLITQGMAFDEQRVLMVHSGDSSVTATTAHEFVHMLVGDALGPAYSRVPTWLNEGLAEYGSRHGGDRYILNPRVQQAIAQDQIRPLWHLGTYSGTPQEIIIAYAHGESVVTFMVLEYGEEKMSELMQAIINTLDIDVALMEVYGLDQHGIDSAWREAIGLEPLPRPEAPNQRPELDLSRIPDATLAPILMPTFPPRETPAPQSASEPQATATPMAPVAAAPTAAAPVAAAPTPELAAVEPSAPATEPEGPAPASAPESGAVGLPEPASGGCAPPAAGATSGDLAMLLLLGAPLGLVAVGRRRAKQSGLTIEPKNREGLNGND